ncbi:MAG: hypothetical protein R2780_01385 [Crocinitomicaceae bacterium]|nr:hypothetical protein [Crocinitomicaceae bacterium]
MEDKVYQLEGSTVSYEMGFENDIVYCHLIRRLKEAPVNQITQVIIKNPGLSLGEEIAFRIHYNENGSEKKFPWVQAKNTDAKTQAFLDDLKSRLNPTVIWIDKTDTTVTDDSGNKVYDLQYLPFGYSGAGLPRAVQIWIYLICLGILVIPLIYYIYILATGGYRIYTNDQGLTVRKASATTFAWDELEHPEFTRVKVYDGNAFSKNEVLKVKFIGKNGKKKAGVMRYDHALPLLEELGERGIISADYLSNFS